jgi:uncharacterized repeat protein (TIGR01451 family)
VEGAYANYVTVVGLYSGDNTVYYQEDSYEVFAEDLAIEKVVDPRQIVIGQASTWTVRVRSSEYGAPFKPIAIADTVPDGNCPGDTPGCNAGPPSQTYGSAIENANGTWTVSWDLPEMGRSETQTLTYQTEALAYYREGFADDTPVLAGDRWRNDAQLYGDAGGQPLRDESWDFQKAPLIAIEKEVAEPVASLDSCGDGSSLTWLNNAAPPYSPGDRVCWRIRADVPQAAAQDLSIQDYLPPGFTFESWDKGTNNTVSDDEIDFVQASSKLVQWSLGGGDSWTAPGSVFEAVISSIAGDPADFADADVVGNLMKVRYTSSDGDAFGSRDQENTTFTSPVLGLTKFADHEEIVAGDIVEYSVSIEDIGTGVAANVEVWDIIPPEFACTDIQNISFAGSCTDGTIKWLLSQIQARAASVLTYELVVPANIAPGTMYTNYAGVRSYTGTLNHGEGATVFYPINNIDPSVADLENAPEAYDEWTLFAVAAAATKSTITSVNESGNNAVSAATIGETLTFTASATVPAGTTVYDAILRDGLDFSKVVYVPGSVLATVNGAAIPYSATPIPDEFTVSDTDGAITITFPEVYTVPNGDPDTVAEFVVDVTVLDGPANVRGEWLNNQARFRWDDQNGESLSLLPGAGVRIVEQDLHIAKTDNTGDGFVQPGETVEYTLLISNPRSDFVTFAHDLVVIDLVPQLTGNSLMPLGDSGAPVSANGDNVPPFNGTWSEDDSTITWDLSFLEPTGLVRDGEVTLTYEAIVADTLVVGTVITNEATVTGTSLVGSVPGERTADSPDGGPGSGYQATATDTVYPPAVHVTKVVTPESATIGEEVTFTATYVFPKDVTAFDSTIIDQLPAGLTVTGVDVSPPNQYTVAWNCLDDLGNPCIPGLTELTPVDNAVGWWLGDMLVDDTAERTWTVEYVARIDDDPAAVGGVTLTNRVAGFSNTSDTGMTPPTTVPDPGIFDAKTADAIADVAVVEPGLLLRKRVLDGPDNWVKKRRALPNESLDYRIAVRNEGTSPAYDVAVGDTITTPAGRVMGLGVVSSGTGYVVVDGDPSDGTLAWTLTDPLAPGDAVIITYTLVVWDADSAGENPTGPEIINGAGGDNFGVAAATRDPEHDEWYRKYETNSNDVDIELDLASVGDLVWYDVNGDGAQDAGEPPIEGAEVTVTYLGLDGVVGGGDDESHVAVTDSLGNYLVVDLPGGAYLAEVTGGMPGGMNPSYDLEHGSVNPDGTSEFTLGEAEHKADVDFGYIGVNSLGDLVWWDRDGDGSQDPSSPGIEGIEITVTFFGFDGIVDTADDVIYPMVTTDPIGAYTVVDLPIGTYRVDVAILTVPTDMFPTYDLDGGHDSTAVGDLRFTGDNRTDFDFGYRGVAYLGNRIWFDLNRDGVQDGGEPGLAGVAVVLTWPGPNGVLGDDDDVDIETKTIVDGFYVFHGLNSGDYQVTVDTTSLPEGMSQTYDPDGVLDDTTTVEVLPTSEIHDIDFGYAGDGAIGDTVWWDADTDGIKDAGEPGLSNARVKARWWGDNNIPGDFDDVIWATTTDGVGSYAFVDLPEGTFDVTVFGALLNAMAPTYDLDGGLDNTANLTLELGESRTDVDFGYNGTNTIGDTVWYDLDANAIEDADEPGIPGVDMAYVWFGINGVEGDGDDVSLPGSTTDADGRYHFMGIPKGNHRVRVTSGLPAGVVQKYDEDGGLDGTTVVLDLAGNTDYDAADFGYTGTGTIGDSVWWDLDGNGEQSLAEPEWSGVTVTLRWAAYDGVLDTADDVLQTSMTASKWSISNLPGGLYRVEINRADLPSDVYQTYSPDGVLDDTAELTLPSGAANLDQDLGYRGVVSEGQSAAIGDLVWLDLNRDGVPDVGEPGVDAALVTIVYLGPDGVPGGGDDVEILQVSGTNGDYGAEGLVGGAYQVDLDASTLPAGLVPHSDSDGGDPAQASVVLDTGEANLNVDFGVAGSDIGDTVWIDSNGNGVKDLGEAGIPNVLVQLVNDDGGVMVGAVTDADGFYVFRSVGSGSYTVVVVAGSLPADVEQISSRDGNLDGTTPVTVGDPSDQLDVDFGYEQEELPVTGINIVPLAVVAAVLLLAGAIALAVTHRKED